MNSVDNIQKLINEYIDNQSFSGTPAELYAPIEYILRQGGKRMRPTLCLLACDLFGGDINDCLTPAIAAEIFHNFTLVHDDIMDQAPLRRGMETVYYHEVFAELCKVALEVCEGQQYDLNFETQDNVTLDSYLEMIRLKTAVLLGSVLKIGAITAQTNAKNQEAIYNFGISLGMAFQLQDDIFDCYGDVSVFGKMTGGDISDNKKTYLYLKALELSSEEDKEILINL